MTTAQPDIQLTPIGRVESSLTDPADAPKQAHEDAPQATLVFEPHVAAGLAGLRVGDEIMLLTWLHRAARDVLRTHPRGDPANPARGVFSTRSPARPNPIGLHPVQIVAIEDCRIVVRHLEAVDGTPILDVKPVLVGWRA
ncbi:MAG: tRNA (N6-threonylcarbamoyladenosine(37)-N6)-methyltransferase TrmO [Solirubrobacteraceae bacterium]